MGRQQFTISTVFSPVDVDLVPQALVFSSDVGEVEIIGPKILGDADCVPDKFLKRGRNFYNQLFYRIPGLLQAKTRREQKQHKTDEEDG